MTLTDSELQYLRTAQPDDSTVVEWMTAHNVEYGDDIIVHFDGEPNAAVYTTDKADFMTRDAVASRLLRNPSDVAREILGLENEIDERSLSIESEAVETGAEQLSVEEAQKIGEPPVENFGIEDPSITSAKNVFENVSLNVRMDVAEDLRVTANGLSEHADDFSSAESTFLDGIANCTSRLETVINKFDDFSEESIRTEISQTFDELYTPMQAGMRIGEQTISEIRNYTRILETKLAEHTQFAVDADENFKSVVGEEAAVDVTPVTTTIETAKTTIDETEKLNKALLNVDAVNQMVINPPNLRDHMDHLQNILKESYSRPIDRNELAEVVQQLKELSANEEARIAYKAAQSSVNTLIQQLTNATRELDPASS
ncbi:MAG: hypothetical protein JWO54_712 [Candidatus Saccharibacteria bacterium]|nr:hypothetical protein [Candidatus Saccharibacteria bacterium]MDB5180949.1 hypothetical protein [Candidatus Saccharibacteria bacterium]